MTKYDEITAARKVLDLGKIAKKEEIKNNYMKLIIKWHPDRCKEQNKGDCEKMTDKIVKAYRILTAYCGNYDYSFSKDEVGKYIPVDEWWQEHFGEVSG